MRIWFGLILKITARTKSYILPELCYLIKSIGKCAKLQFFSRSIPSCSEGLVFTGEVFVPHLGVSASDLPEDSSDYGLVYYIGIPNGDVKHRTMIKLF